MPHAKRIQKEIEKKKKVFKYDNLPWRPPFGGTVAFGLLLDRLRAPGWVWGVFITIMAIVWIAWIHQAYSYVYVDAFPEDRDESHHWPATHKSDQNQRVN